MQGLQIGHFTDEKAGTGASVFLFDRPAIAAFHLCGSSPATHDMGSLALDANVTHINGLVLLGGSAYGLAAAAGAMRWVAEQGQGWPAPHGSVPIVPAAAIYDLAYQAAIPPDAESVYRACVEAREGNDATGRVGAGTGATVGKLVPGAARMSGGLGRAVITLANGVTVLVYAVVNSVGDVYDATGQIIAGARWPNGEFANCQQTLIRGEEVKPASTNTTLVAVFTDAHFSKTELTRIAKMAVAGMGRAIAPVFTRYDGDIVFAVSVGDKSASELMIGAAAAEMTRQAILNAVQQSVTLT